MTCNTIDNHNIIRQSGIALEKYWVKQSGYFRLATAVALGMSISDGKLLFCHGISEGNLDKNISTREYNNRTVYDCFNNTFTADFGTPYLNLPPMTIDDRPSPHERARFTPDLLPDTISVFSGKSVSTLITPSALQKTLLLSSDYTNHRHAMKKDEPDHGRMKRRYRCRKHDEIRCQKKNDVLLLHVLW